MLSWASKEDFLEDPSAENEIFVPAQTRELMLFICLCKGASQVGFCNAGAPSPIKAVKAFHTKKKNEREGAEGGRVPPSALESKS